MCGWVCGCEGMEGGLDLLVFGFPQYSYHVAHCGCSAVGCVQLVLCSWLIRLRVIGCVYVVLRSRSCVRRRFCVIGW